MISIIAQALNITSNYISSWVTKKHQIILFKCLSSLFSAISIIAVGNLVSAIPVLFTIIRCIVCFFKDKFKNNWPIYLICVGYIIIAVGSIPFYTSVVDVFPVVISLAASLILWFCDSIGIKIGIGIGDTLWVIFHSVNGLYLSALNTALQVVLSIISIIRIKTKRLSI
ncbi:MAG: YgjV family protein [Agathobacter sp.]|nr:YgjV family protein [Agathobacter sp.]